MVVKGKNLDTKRLVQLANSALESAVNFYSKKTGLSLAVEPSETIENSDKYAFKTVSRLQGLETDSKAVMVFFEPGDGTGSRKNYTIGSVPERHTPRTKDGYSEIFFPIGTSYCDNDMSYFFLHLTSLDAMTLKSPNSLTLDTYKTLGTDRSNYISTIVDGITTAESTVYTVNFGQLTFLEYSFGNPHAIRFTNDVLFPPNNTILQIGAFIALKKKNEKTQRLVHHAGAGYTKTFYSSDATVYNLQ